MTALRTDLNAPPGAAGNGLRLTSTELVTAEPSQWFDLETVAEAIGANAGSLRRECPRLERQRLARKVKLDGERNTRWQIHRAYHPQLAKLQGPAAITPDRSPTKVLMSATSVQREEAMRKGQWLAEFRRWKSSPSVNVRRDYAAWSASLSDRLGRAPNLATIYRWNDAAPGEGDTRGVAAALLDGRGGNGGAPTCGENAWSFFRRIYLTTNKPSVALAWRMTRVQAAIRAEEGEDGWEWPSRPHVSRMVNERISRQEIVLAREGKDAWEKLFKAPMEQDPDAWGAGERWDADHSRFDCFIRVLRGGFWKAERAWLTAWIDWRTRRLMGWMVTTSPDSGSVRTSLLHALRTGASPPRIAWLDNGKDFASATITGATKKERRTRREARRLLENVGRLGAAHTCDGPVMLGLLGLLGIEVHFAQPYNHNGKSRIERFFRIMHENFCRLQPSWCGSKPGDRDRDSLDRVLEDVSALPTLEEFAARFDTFAGWYNQWDERSIDDLVVDGERLSPDAFYTRCLAVRRVLPDPSALTLLEQRWSRPLAVTKRGVGLRFRGRTVRYGSTHTALDDFKRSGRKVFVTLDPQDVSSVRVFDERMRFVCVAELNGAYGGENITKEAMDEAVSIRRAQHRRAKERVDVAAILPDDASAAAHVQRRIDSAKRKALPAAAASAPGPALKIVATPLDGQAERVANAERQRRVRVLVDSTADSMDEAIDLNDVEPPTHPFRDAEDDEFDFNDCSSTVEEPLTEEENFDLTLDDTDPEDRDDFDVLGELSRG